jgi:hypothetical protein
VGVDTGVPGERDDRLDAVERRRDRDRDRVVVVGARRPPRPVVRRRAHGAAQRRARDPGDDARRIHPLGELAGDEEDVAAVWKIKFWAPHAIDAM